MTPRTFMAIAVAACLAAAPAAAVAQETVNQASISGRVVDPQSARGVLGNGKHVSIVKAVYRNKSAIL